MNKNIPAMTWENGVLIETTLEEIRKKFKPLSQQDIRKPISPEYLVDALNDPIHKEIGNFRVSKVARKNL